jgi:hypothetical protein
MMQICFPNNYFITQIFAKVSNLVTIFSKPVVKETDKSWALWVMTVILATQKAEIGRAVVEG